MALCLRGLLSSRIRLAVLPVRTPILLVGLRSQSTLSKPPSSPLCVTFLKKATVPVVFCREMSGTKTFIVMPSRYGWRRFKTSVHFWTMLTLIPMFSLIMYCNIFIGPAELQEIPPGYYPKEWEYYPHPISRWIAKNMVHCQSPQQVHEMKLHRIDEEMNKARIRRLEKKVRALMNERKDYAGYEWKPWSGYYYNEISHDRARMYEEEHVNALRSLR